MSIFYLATLLAGIAFLCEIFWNHVDVHLFPPFRLGKHMRLHVLEERAGVMDEDEVVRLGLGVAEGSLEERDHPDSADRVRNGPLQGDIENE